MVHVVFGDHRIRHDDFAVIAPQIHRLAGRIGIGKIMKVVSCYEQVARVARVGRDPFGSRVVKMTLVEPQMMAVVETDQRTTAGQLEVAKANVRGPEPLTDIENVLTRVGPRDDRQVARISPDDPNRPFYLRCSSKNRRISAWASRDSGNGPTRPRM